ncbi:DUF3850 domain-containing protein [Jiulongibacter sediminis]|uniref:DUF3850 domain-containing protein n=1 Tax=Jiulongibacter sediminis TaxID=1605367 RepID=UPI0026F00471|nr:DUF3850 domain-containing protein [Jiulongibacter sediminis]
MKEEFQSQFVAHKRENSVHRLKTWPEYFNKVASGSKTFEIRVDDRNFQVNDELLLEEYIPKDYKWKFLHQNQEGYTGKILHRRVTSVFRDDLPGIESGYILMSIEKI